MNSKLIAGLLIGLLVVIGTIGYLGNNDKAIEITKSETEMAFDISKQPYIGDNNAENEIILLFDYNCPGCQSWEQTVLPSINDYFIDKELAKLYLVNYPILGPGSTIAAMAGEYVHDNHPESFKEFNEKVFDAAPNISVPKLISIASDVTSDIDEDAMKAALENQEYIDHVLSDINFAKEVGATGTPTVLVNGTIVPSSDLNEMAAHFNETTTEDTPETEQSEESGDAE